MNNETVDPTDSILDSLDPAGREVEDEYEGLDLDEVAADDPCLGDD